MGLFSGIVLVCVGFLEWVLTGFTMGGFRWGGFTVVEVGFSCVDFMGFVSGGGGGDGCVASSVAPMVATMVIFFFFFGFV